MCVCVLAIFKQAKKYAWRSLDGVRGLLVTTLLQMQKGNCRGFKESTLMLHKYNCFDEMSLAS